MSGVLALLLRRSDPPSATFTLPGWKKPEGGPLGLSNKLAQEKGQRQKRGQGVSATDRGDLGHSGEFAVFVLSYAGSTFKSNALGASARG